MNVLIQSMIEVVGLLILKQPHLLVEYWPFGS